MEIVSFMDRVARLEKERDLHIEAGIEKAEADELYESKLRALREETALHHLNY